MAHIKFTGLTGGWGEIGSENDQKLPILIRLRLLRYVTGHAPETDERTAMPLMRRDLLAALVAAPVLSPCLAGSSQAQGRPPFKAATPSCGTDRGPTPALDEGPFFKAGAPDRHRLVEPGTRGEAMTVAGVVTDTLCRPIKGALVQIWHTDAAGDYDNVGHRFRGAHRTDATGRWWFSTIVPALYPGRTRHFHMKVLSPGRRLLTTQLYFPGEPGNARDAFFDKRLVLAIRQAADGKFGHFDFVV